VLLYTMSTGSRFLASDNAYLRYWIVDVVGNIFGNTAVMDHSDELPEQILMSGECQSCA
jgi:hypothetical protein